MEERGAEDEVSNADDLHVVDGGAEGGENDADRSREGRSAPAWVVVRRERRGRRVTGLAAVAAGGPVLDRREDDGDPGEGEPMRVGEV